MALPQGGETGEGRARAGAGAESSSKGGTSDRSSETGTGRGEATTRDIALDRGADMHFLVWLTVAGGLCFGVVAVGIQGVLWSTGSTASVCPCQQRVGGGRKAEHRVGSSGPSGPLALKGRGTNGTHGARDPINGESDVEVG